MLRQAMKQSMIRVAGLLALALIATAGYAQ